MRALIALALVACGSTASTPIQSRSAAPTTPAPRIAWMQTAFDARSFPQIARSGKTVVIALSDNDGGRGFPNLRFEIRDRTDRVVDKHVVMIANEYEQLVPDGLHPTAELERRIASANTWLAQQHAAYDFVAMTEVAIADQFAYDAPIDTADARVTVRPDHRIHVRTADDKELTLVDGSAWLAPVIPPRCAQCEPCKNEAFVHAVYKVERIDVIVLRIRYAGNDTCWEPSDQLHVIAW